MGRAIARRYRKPRRGGVAAGLALVVALMFAGASWAKTSDSASTVAAKAAVEHDPAKLYIDADKLVYDKDHDVVTADGAVVLYYKGRILQADHVVYDRNPSTSARPATPSSPMSMATSPIRRGSN